MFVRVIWVYCDKKTNVIVSVNVGERQGHLTRYARRRVSQLHENRRRRSTSPPHHKMALLVDKHRPRNLEALSYHPELSDRLRALVSIKKL